MNTVRTMAKPVSWFLVVFMVIVFSPYQTVLAKMITTEIVLDAARVNASRAYVETVLSRKDVTAALVSQGIDVKEARARINALSDAEIIDLADRMENLPAGGSSLGIVVGAVLVIFVVLLVTDILGYTDVFTFVRKRHA